MPIRIGPEGLLGQPRPHLKPYAEDMEKAMFNFAYPVTHTADMLGGLGELAAGLTSKYFTHDSPEGEELVSGAGDYLSQYSPENIGTTLRERPFSSAVDILPLAAGAYGAGRLGTRALVRPAQAPDGIVAYHGSPYDFEKFDMAHLGSGEGVGTKGLGHAGKGFYFAEHPKVAERYRDVLTREKNATRGAVIQDENGSWVREPNTNPLKGKVYEARLPPERALIDLNKKIGELPPDLQELAAKHGFNADEQAHWFFRKAGIDELKKLGIKGTVHNDPLHHTKKYKGKNYSVFDPEDIEILRKYGLIGAVGAGAYTLPDDGQAAPFAFPVRR